MPAEIVYAPEVELDLAEAYGWYEAQQPGLGEEFLRCVEASLRALSRHPGMYPVVHETMRFDGPCLEVRTDLQSLEPGEWVVAVGNLGAEKADYTLTRA